MGVCSTPNRSQFFDLPVQSVFSSHPVATVSSDVTKVGVLVKWTDTHIVVVPSPPKQCGFKSHDVQTFMVQVSEKILFTDCTATHSSNEAKLIGPMKFIITHNIVAQSSFPTGVGSNPARPQCFSRYISVLFQYRRRDARQ